MVTEGGGGDSDRMNDRYTSGAYRWNLSPELEAERRTLQAEHAELERQHLEMLAAGCDAAAEIALAEKTSDARRATGRPSPLTRPGVFSLRQTRSMTGA